MHQYAHIGHILHRFAVDFEVVDDFLRRSGLDVGDVGWSAVGLADVFTGRGKLRAILAPEGVVVGCAGKNRGRFL